MTLFPAMVVVDVKRQQKRKHFCCPCVSVPPQISPREEKGPPAPDAIDVAVASHCGNQRPVAAA